jgi:hypothetical protein
MVIAWDKKAKVELRQGLRRDLNPPQAVSFDSSFESRCPQPPILTRLYYEGQVIILEK